jgi:tetratricopeptide (TPR) repeat protein
MKTKYIIIAALSLLLLNTSCSDDFLEKNNPNSPTANQFWQTEDHAIGALASTYGVLNFNSRWNSFECGWGIENWKSDDILYTSEYFSFRQIATFLNTPDVWEVETFYKNGYQFVNRANQCIEGIPQCDISDAKKEQYVAEAKFLRAYGYFKLLRNFRHLPFYASYPKTNEDLYPAQVDRSVVWALVEADLQEAVNKLPKTRSGSELGRATSGAAAAFLGYAYLYQQKYPEAKTILKRIVDMDLGNYALLHLANYSENWNGVNEFNSESLFELQFFYTNWATANVFTLEFLAWQEANASSWIFNQFNGEEDKDGNMQPRYFQSMLSPLHDFNVPGYGNFAVIDVEGRNSGIILKHTTPTWATGNRYENNYPLMRYADVLLMLAEAVNEVDGPDAARPFINQVRARANMVDVPTGLTKEQFRQRVMSERAIELCFESRRWYDLVRWHEAGFINIKDVLTANGKQGAENFTDNYLYFPIPESEYETNPNVDRSKQW